MQLIINFTNILQHLCPYYTHAKVKKNKKYITMPKLRPFEHKGDFPNLETFNIYKQWEYNMECVQMSACLYTVMY